MKYTPIIITLLCIAAIVLLLFTYTAIKAIDPYRPEVNAEGLGHPVQHEPLVEITLEPLAATPTCGQLASDLQPTCDQAASEPAAQPSESSDADELARMLYGEARGCSLEGQQKAVWCVLNRVDSKLYPDTVKAVISQPNQFYGYSPYHPVLDELKAVAQDVLNRWQAEKNGEQVARELPPTYLYFSGDGVENYFREG